jgi:S1-C subfamily serine protease
MRFIQAFTLSITALAVAPVLLHAQKFDDARFKDLARAVVRIDLPNEVGSGIVLHQEAGYAVILTAYHVVDSKKNISVYFYGDNSKTKWTVQNPVDSLGLYDLAVLRIRSTGTGTAPRTPVLTAGANPEEGSLVRAIGHDGNNFWIHSADGQVVRETDSNEPTLFRFTKTNVAKGYSGGPVFNSNLELVGMTVQISKSDDLAKALKLETILDVVRGSFGFVELNRLKVAEKGGAALEVLRDRYKQISRSEKALTNFFDGRRTEARRLGYPFRGAIDLKIAEVEDQLADAKRFLDGKQTPSAQKALDAAEQSLKALEAMK